MAFIVFVAFFALAINTTGDLFKYHGVPALTWAKIALLAVLFITWKLLIV